ncbi:hypothetical protein GRP75_03960 [Paenibacillus sp. OT2-17]|uniref:hypothetical protein n=1 Tax=Paenibacillus sp. OT2-17 TaxID=2691605 RepID=UPI001352D959|nr:hypothetical protein [Paenibacillus sp. OT2-17]MBP1174308.1 hypothetical protein [Paenibacillus sp. PvR133]MXO77021.1 hypothetical protein [Paenibacillus sp. OT2-17]
MKIHLSFIWSVIKKIWWFKAGRPLRGSFDLTIAALLQIQMNHYAANRLKSTLFLKLVCVAFLTHKRTYLALR